jgi:hypothetical protein
MDIDLVNIYLNSITEIYDKKSLDKKKIDINNVKVEKIVSNYSNTKVPIFKMVINKKVISRNNSYVIIYKCQHCGINNSITLNLFTRKLNKNITKCNNCKNQDDIKKDNHSKWMKENASKIKNKIFIKEKKIKSINDLISESKEYWNNMDDDFKEAYIKKHLTNDEYDRIKDKIISINNDKITDVMNYQYIFNYKINNQTLFNPMIINFDKKLIERIVYIKFRCENCNSLFVNRDLYIQKNKYKILCKDCSFCNNTFKIRNMTNIKNEKVIYQSQFEKKFIIYCNENNILIQNGDKIKYKWNNKNLNYKIDFKIPEKKYLIELKDDYKEKINVKNEAKINAAKLFASNIGYEYFIIFPKNYMNFIKKLKNSV